MVNAEVIGKNISLRGFNLGASMQHAPRALGELFKFVIDGRVKVEITKYPLADASSVDDPLPNELSNGKASVAKSPTESRNT